MVALRRQLWPPKLGVQLLAFYLFLGSGMSLNCSDMRDGPASCHQELQSGFRVIKGPTSNEVGLLMLGWWQMFVNKTEDEVDLDECIQPLGESSTLSSVAKVFMATEVRDSAA